MKNFLFALRPVLRDLAGTLIFVALWALTGSQWLAVGCGIALSIAQLGWSILRRHPIETLQWISAGIVIVFGGASLVTHDLRFVMAKPTIIFAIVGITMLKPRWQWPYVPPIARAHVSEAQIAFWGRIWAVMMFVIAVANAALVWFAPFSAWVIFHTVGATPFMLLLAIAQYLILRAHVRRSILQARTSGATA